MYKIICVKSVNYSQLVFSILLDLKDQHLNSSILKRITRFCRFSNRVVIFYYWLLTFIILCYSNILKCTFRTETQKPLVDNRPKTGFSGFLLKLLTSHFKLRLQLTRGPNMKEIGWEMPPVCVNIYIHMYNVWNKPP